MSDSPDFVHLRTRSHYSLLSAPVEVDALVAAAASDGQRAIALTDNGNLFGTVEFYKACKSKSLKAIIGMSAFVAGRTMHEPSGPDNPTHDLTLLAINNQGLDNLRRLTSQSWLKGFHYRPRMDLAAIAAHREGLLCLTGSVAGQIAQSIQQNDAAAAKDQATKLIDIFGKDQVFFEVAETGTEAQRTVTEGKKRLSQLLDIQCVATNDVHYLKQEDWLAQDILLCIRNGKTVADQDRFRMSSRDLFLKSRAQMAASFHGWTEPLSATVAIAERCEVKMDFGIYHLPLFKPDTGETPDDFFVRRCREGALLRFGTLSQEVIARLEYEIEIVKKLGFVSYFLIVQDFILKAKSLGIPVGPGRGSAAGSLVAYALQITNVDPLRYSLLFERFLNPGRVSMPDIDIDFCGNRREEVIEYVRNKYGSDCVCQIITFGTMASRGVLRDVGRVLDFDLGEIDKLCKKIPQGPLASLATALTADPELKALRESTPQHKRLFDLSLKLEGLARHSSVHAAGVVIADRPLQDYVPLAKNGEDIVTQWQMTDLEDVGLLKMDFLGLKTLTTLNETVRLICEVHGVEIDLAKLPLDDRDTFALMTRGETQGVFQLESSGMRELLQRLKPDTFEDVIAVLALYRPGPLGSGMVDTFVRRKHGEESVNYPHLDTEPVLKPTYGVIVYQEQVMQIANLIGGFSMSDADNLRKAMGKKKPEVMAKYKDQFVDGAKARNYGERFARELFETMEFFAGYGFNKSHSTAYALVTYQTAWLKTHYPCEFTAANLTVESNNTDKVKEFVDEARRHGMRLLPPSVNHSHCYFCVEDKSIRFGLGAIKGVGARAAELIAKQRLDRGPYQSLEDLCDRLDNGSVNKIALEALVQAGALDDLGKSRRSTFTAIESALKSSAMAREDRRRGQKLLFGAPPAAPTKTPGSAAIKLADEWIESDRLLREKESLGFYLSGHPFEKRGTLLRRIAGQTTASLAGLEPGASVRIAGMVSSVQVKQIKQGKNAGQKMAHFRLEDLAGAVSVVCFARTFALVKERLIEDSIVFLTGRLDREGEEPSLRLDQIEPAAEVIRREVAGLVLLLRGHLTSESSLSRILALCDKYRGQQHLHFDVEDGDTIHRIRAETGIRITDDLLDEFALTVGPDAISFTRT
jgi:DNA polymerase-3 subunit alpha